MSVAAALGILVVSYLWLLRRTFGILYMRKTRFQRILVLANPSRTVVKLFLDGELQFSSVDEHIYHESLVHPAIATALMDRAPRSALRVLVLGGGDGMAARECLKYGERVASITIVDIDRGVTGLFSQGTPLPTLARLCDNALDDSRVTVINDDARRVIADEAHAHAYDVILMDLPDPTSALLASLYSATLLTNVARCLAPAGTLCVQGSNPDDMRYHFTTVHNRLHACMGRVVPYVVDVPSFGIWGFFLCHNLPLSSSAHALTERAIVAHAAEPRRFLSAAQWHTAVNDIIVADYNA